MLRTMVSGNEVEDKGPKGREGAEDLVLPWWYWCLLGFQV